MGAAFGVLTATFQWGWGLGVIGLPSPYGTVSIASFVPLMMFAALFGLSMDYEIFLVSQIAQHHAAGEEPRQAAGEEPRQAVRSGVAAAAKVIAAAATIMIAVFASFILNSDPTVKHVQGPGERVTDGPAPDGPAPGGPAAGEAPVTVAPNGRRPPDPPGPPERGQDSPGPERRQ